MNYRHRISDRWRTHMKYLFFYETHVHKDSELYQTRMVFADNVGHDCLNRSTL